MKVKRCQGKPEECIYLTKVCPTPQDPTSLTQLCCTTSAQKGQPELGPFDQILDPSFLKCLFEKFYCTYFLC